MSSTDTDDPPGNVPADLSDGATQEPLDFNGPDPIGEQISPERRIKIPQDAAPKALTRPTYFSFGDNGTTATVNAYGRILQISKFSEHARSGFFCVDLPSMAEPYYVKRRMKNIIDLIDEPAAGIGIDWDHTFETTGDAIRDKPTVEFIDDRWPLLVFEQSQYFEYPTRSSQRFSPGSFRSRLSLQYLCNGGTIFQRYVLTREMQGATANKTSIPTRLKLSTDLLIRDTDFTEKTSFNISNRESGYTFRHGPDRENILVTHVISNESRREMDIEPDGMTDGWPSSITLIIQAFATHPPQEGGSSHTTALKVSESGGTWYIDLSPDVQRDIRDSGTLDVSIAYTLHVQCDTEQSKSLDIPGSDSNKLRAAFSSLTKTAFEQLRFSCHPHLDFTIRRNLEHILSVCSIPTTQGPVNDTQQKAAAVALTCGDISGHRVALSASFFAFQFLLFADRHLRGKKSDKCVCEGKTLSTCKAYSCKLRHRVQETCIGHLKWVFVNTQANRNRISLHYWATGRPIKVKTHLPLESPADSALQILKIFDPSKDPNLYENWRKRLSGSMEENIRKRIRAWAEDLEHGDKRKKYAFPRLIIDSQEKFRLSDHVQISSAFRLIQGLGGNPPLGTERLLIDEPDGFVSKNFNANEVQRSILKRFTTEDSVSGRRMLATTRTASETRFLFHSKDTVLLYAMDDGIFTKYEDEKDDDDDWDKQESVWVRTMDCQAEHDEAQRPNRKKPLWFALMAIVGIKGRTINLLEPENATQVATKALLDSSSRNGLFPGCLDEDNQPTIFKSERCRDKYWHTTFEIPYFFWRYGEDHFEERNRKPKLQITEPYRMTEIASFIKRDKFVDRRYLLGIADDWLQKGPKALNFMPEFQFSGPGSDDSPPNINFDRDLNAADEFIVQIPPGPQRILSSSDERVKGVVVDVPRGHSERKGEGISKNLMTNQELDITLGRIRTVDEAKKRLIWLPQGDRKTEKLCKRAAPKDDQVDIAIFFERHRLYDNYFSDKTSPSRNEWTTELHISFYLLTELSMFDEIGTRDGIPQFSPVDLNILSRRKGDKWSNLSLTKGTSKGIARASMSFRFVGDFFDRYWTCHFLEYLPYSTDSHYRQGSTLKDRLLEIGWTEEGVSQNDRRKKYPWQQRRVLELLLLHEMLAEIIRQTDMILSWIRETIFRQSDFYQITRSVDPPNPLAEALALNSLLSKENGEHYRFIVDPWRKLARILRAVEENLSENLKRIEDFNGRKKEDEQLSPRWTQNDERTFRPTLDKLRSQTQRQVQDLYRLQTRISEFRDTLTNGLTTIREDEDFRGSENINLFTYVTVVFLPLGFATGIFSMSGAPERATLINMIELASIAMAVTAFALANAQTSGKAVVRPINFILRGINELLLLPLIQLFYLAFAPLLIKSSNWLLYKGFLARKMAAYLLFEYVLYPVSLRIGRRKRNLWT